MPVLNLVERCNGHRFSDFKAISVAEGMEEPESQEHYIAAWQYLHDTRLAYKLQGWYGRAVTQLIDEGEVMP